MCQWTVTTVRAKSHHLGACLTVGDQRWTSTQSLQARKERSPSQPGKIQIGVDAENERFQYLVNTWGDADRFIS